MKNEKLVMIGIGILVIGILVGSYFVFFYSPYKFTEDRPIKIFILNSFHEEFPANLVLGYTKGIIEILEKENVDFTLKRYDMDMLRKDENEQQEAVMEAKNLIDEFNPDLLFATNEAAQRLIIIPYYLNIDLPVVSVALTEDPADYGYIDAKNIAGVIQNNRFEDAIDYLKSLFPSVKKIAVIGSSEWEPVVRDLEKQQDEIEGIEFIGWHTTPNFEGLKKLVIDYQDEADAFLFTPLDFLIDQEGNEVSIEDASRWVVENNNLPEASLWPTPSVGFLSAVINFPYEQGKEAGKIAYGILIEGKKPSSFGFKSAKIGLKMINLARAKTLGLEKEDIPSTILINSEVIETFPWEEESDF